MKTLVVYDSYYGNTEKIAGIIVDALSNDIELRKVDQVKGGDLVGLDFLIVGSPTRGFRPSDKVKKFLKKIPAGSMNGKTVAAFDTRMDPEDVGNPILKFLVGIFGYAADPIANKLVKKGGIMVGKPVGFVVVGREGPLRQGETEKAVSWAESLVSS